ncbi:uncharacterized protein LOC133037346 [Cannabis sativa]|uniref:uncharacterized protein LOC133037346 n=1 Tax=Cannabis sativa TaxID=3483 RepID=UPI0029CA4CA4|nr:uncharacterized protein LOC133037346 [Cannabis sativa]
MSWYPPHPNSFMINTDASLIMGQAGYSISAVIRDSEGSLLVAETEFVNGYSSVLLAEASAILLGLRLALSRSILQAQVASDNATIINNIQLKSANKSEWNPIVQNIIHFRDSFQSLDFLFVPRDCNKVANSLAKWSRLTQKSAIWTDCLPNCAAAILIADKPSVA